MTATLTERKTLELNGTQVLAKLHLIAVKEATKILGGTLVAIDATGYLVPFTSATGLVACGVAQETVDNTDGSSGDLFCKVQSGVYKFKNSADADLIAQAHLFGLCYGVDNQTVSLTSNGGTRSVAGIVYRIDSDGVYVLVMPPAPPTVGAGLSQLGVLSFNLHKLVDGSAAATLSETAFARAGYAGTILAAYYVPDAALTADDTDYGTLTVKIRDGAGGAAATVASKTTKITGGSGDWTAFVPVSLGAITNGTLAAGSILTALIAKAASGVVIPAGQFVIVYAFS
jgi:hypothetical protein